MPLSAMPKGWRRFGLTKLHQTQKNLGNSWQMTKPKQHLGGTLQVDVIIEFFEVMWVKTPKRDFSATPEKGQKGDDEAGES